MRTTSTAIENKQDLIKYIFLKTTDRKRKNHIANFDLKLFPLPISYPLGRCFR